MKDSIHVKINFFMETLQYMMNSNHTCEPYMLDVLDRLKVALNKFF